MKFNTKRFRLHLTLSIIIGISILTLQLVNTVSAQGEDRTSSPEEVPDHLISIMQSKIDLNGDFIVSGNTDQENIYISKIDSDGLILWSMIIGGSEGDFVENLLIDANNDIILLGRTSSPDIFLANDMILPFGGDLDFLIIKISTDGNILWNTYLGGSGRDYAEPYDDIIQFDLENNLLLIGYTGSDDFPITDDAFQDIFAGGTQDINENTYVGDLFVTKIDETGSLVFSTYLGGSGIDWGYISVDQSNNIIAAGGTWSDDFPTTLGAFQEDFGGGGNDAFITKYDPSGIVIFSSYYGGDSVDKNIGIQIDDQDNLYIVSSTLSSNYPTVNANQSTYPGGQAWAITKVSPIGQTLWSTYFGGSQGSTNFRCCFDPTTTIDNKKVDFSSFALDNEGNFVIFSKTYAQDLPIWNAEINKNPQSNLARAAPYLVKFNQDGSIAFSTYIGGSSVEQLGQLGFDSEGNIVVTGITTSNDFLTTFSASQPSIGGSSDVYIMKWSTLGELMWSTYLGGSSTERIYDTMIDSNDNTFVLGTTDSADFPMTDQTQTHNGGIDVFVAKYDSSGNLLWTSVLGGAGDEDVSRFSGMQTPDGSVIVIGTTGSSAFEGQQSSENLSPVGFITKINPNGEMAWTQYLSEPDYTPPKAEDQTIFYVILGSIVIGGFVVFVGSYYWKSLLNSKRASEMLLTTNMDQILSPLFDSNASLIYLLSGQTIRKNENLASKIDQDLPQEIFEHKFLFHPARLSIVKLLTEHIQLTSIEIRNSLGITYNELTNQLNVMEKRNLIVIDQQFIDGAIRNVVKPEPALLSQYESLRDVLIDFLHSTTNLDEYLDHTSKIISRESRDDLYPPNN